MKKCFSNTESFAKKSSASIRLLLGGTVGGKSNGLLCECHRSALVVLQSKGVPQICSAEAKFQPFRMGQGDFHLTVPPTVVRSLIIARTWGAIPEMQDLFDIS